MKDDPSTPNLEYQLKEAEAVSQIRFNKILMLEEKLKVAVEVLEQIKKCGCLLGEAPHHCVTADGALTKIRGGEHEG